MFIMVNEPLIEVRPRGGGNPCAAWLFSLQRVLLPEHFINCWSIG